MEESVDVKALRAKFNSKPPTFDPGNQNSGSPKSPRPAFGRVVVPLPERELVHRLSPTAPLPGPNLLKPPLTDPSKSGPNPRPPPACGVRAAVPPGDASRVRQTGEMLQNMMLRQQRTPGAKPAPPLPPPVATPAAVAILPPLRQPPRQRSAGDVTPLVRPLPPEGPLPLKPRRPPNVNLQPFLRFRRGPAAAALRKGDAGSSGSADRRSSLPAVASPPRLPQRPDKPKGLPRQVASVDFEDEQDPYDDIGSFEKSGSCSDSSLRCLDRENDDDDDNDEIYEEIEEEQVPVTPAPTDKKNKKEVKKQQEQEKKERMLQQKKQNELKKNFQLQGEVEVLHTARARHDWYGGGKLDLSVRQGESVEILRLKNNPGGKWLARSLAGNYGYISNACVDIDYEAIKRKSLYHRKIDTSPLPPPPPDPPQQTKFESNNRDSSLFEDDDYDDVQPMEDFPPPPPEICNDPKMEKELRKKFKYEGPLRVLHTMMVDPNCVIKKPGGKDLHVSRGEVLDVIQLTNSKKALCRNGFGKYGYVFRAYLLPLEGEIYDDVDYSVDVYDNDAPY